jgi:hypothetical protein
MMEAQKFEGLGILSSEIFRIYRRSISARPRRNASACGEARCGAKIAKTPGF